MSQLAYPHLCFPPFTQTQKEKHVRMEARIRAGPTGSPWKFKLSATTNYKLTALTVPGMCFLQRTCMLEFAVESASRHLLWIRYLHDSVISSLKKRNTKKYVNKLCSDWFSVMMASTFVSKAWTKKKPINLFSTICSLCYYSHSVCSFPFPNRHRISLQTY